MDAPMRAPVPNDGSGVRRPRGRAGVGRSAAASAAEERLLAAGVTLRPRLSPSPSPSPSLPPSPLLPADPPAGVVPLALSGSPAGSAVGAIAAVDPSALVQADRNDKEVNRLLMDIINIGEGHGIRFPREFALLLKQFLYFDRYVQALAPELDMFGDARVDMFGALEELPPGLLH